MKTRIATAIVLSLLLLTIPVSSAFALEIWENPYVEIGEGSTEIVPITLSAYADLEIDWYDHVPGDGDALTILVDGHDLSGSHEYGCTSNVSLPPGDHEVGFRCDSGGGNYYIPIAYTITKMGYTGSYPLPNNPPDADAGPDQIGLYAVEGNTIGGAYVSLNGTASSDPDGDPITYLWSGTTYFDDNTISMPIAFCSVGVTNITLQVTDSYGAADTDIVSIEVVDTTPPEPSAVPNTNPAGKPLPFYQLSAQDIVSPPYAIQIFIVDTGSGTVFGPYQNGDTFKYTVARGATATYREVRAPGLDFFIVGNGPGAVIAVDESGNTSGPVPF
jgi:hypothetical protein